MARTQQDHIKKFTYSSFSILKIGINAYENSLLLSEDSLSVEDIIVKIKKLNEMYKSGLISKEEFKILKNKFLKN